MTTRARAAATFRGGPRRRYDHVRDRRETTDLAAARPAMAKVESA